MSVYTRTGRGGEKRGGDGNGDENDENDETKQMGGVTQFVPRLAMHPSALLLLLLALNSPYPTVVQLDSLFSFGGPLFPADWRALFVSGPLVSVCGLM